MTFQERAALSMGLYLQELSLTADLKLGSGFLDLLGFIISLNWQEMLL